MRTGLLFHALAGGAASIQMALPFVDLAAINAAVDPADSGFRACSEARVKLEGCVRRAGGEDGLTTAAPQAIAQCACCNGQRPFSTAYASCSSYLAGAEPTLSAQYSAFDTLYDLCGAGQVACGGGVSATQHVASGTAHRLTTAQGAGPSGSAAPAYTSIEAMIRACSQKTQGFEDMPLSKQASCFCCATVQGRVSWTDELGGHAQTCRDWAEERGSSTLYAAASVLATFCGSFSDACSQTSSLSLIEATAAPSTDATATSDSLVDQASRTGSTAATPSTSSAASGKHAGTLAGLVVAAAIAVAA